VNPNRTYDEARRNNHQKLAAELAAWLAGWLAAAPWSSSMPVERTSKKENLLDGRGVSLCAKLRERANKSHIRNEYDVM